MSDKTLEQHNLPLAGPGDKLRQARESAGLSRADIAQQTRISERLIEKMEAGDFAGLPARTYATGFTRTYARIVGLDDKALVEEVRRELGISSQAAVDSTPDLEPGDPARVPSARFAWWLAIAAVILAAGGFYYWKSCCGPIDELPSILPEETPVIEPTFIPQSIVPTLDPGATFAPSEAPSPVYSPAPVQRPRPRPSASATVDSGFVTPAAPAPAASTVSN